MSNRTRKSRALGGVRGTVLRKLTGPAIALASLGLAMLFAELVLRRTGVDAPGVPSRFRQPNPIFGWSLEPGASYINPLPEKAVRVDYNSAGWRDLERSETKAEGTYRIAVLGDSFVEAYSVDMEAALHQRLEATLVDQGLAAEVLSFGVAGFGTLQELLVFEHTARRYSPDLVLLGFCVANDLQNNSRAIQGMLDGPSHKLHSRPFAELEGDGWRASPVHIEAAQRRYEAALVQRGSLRRALYDRVAFLRLSRDFLINLWRPSPELDSRAQELAIHGIHYCKEPREVTHAWEITRRLLTTLRDAVRAGGAELLVFDEPTLREVDPVWRERIRRSSENPSGLCLEEAPGHQRLMSTLEELGIPRVGLLPDFRQRARSVELFRRSDRHWNENGNQLAADLIAQGLRDADLLPPP